MFLLICFTFVRENKRQQTKIIAFSRKSEVIKAELLLNKEKNIDMCASLIQSVP